MSRKIAVKRLTASDLTIFRNIFETRGAGGNQKSINLNADIFIDVLYPSLPDAPEAEDGRLPVDLYVYGPGPGAELNLQRKIIKGGTYKNWRLDGEFIREEPARFDHLHPDDYVVMEFVGNIVPTQAKLLFVAKTLPADATLYQQLHAVMPPGARSMLAVNAQQLASFIRAAGVPPDHPANEFILDAALEDAVQGGQEGIRRLLSRRSGRAVSVSDLRRARAQNDRDGELGEEFVNEHLSGERTAGRITGFRWESRDNPVSPFDFAIQWQKANTKMDVKSTRGEFERPIHVSIGQLVEMVRGPERYDLYRVYAMTESEARLRVARDVKAFAEGILNSLASLPAGVTVDSVSVLPASVGAWEPETALTLTPDEE
jgi:hypothetical protein